MADSIVTLEAQDDRGDWISLELFFGELEDAKERAENLQQQWLDKGWPKDKIRITHSSFRMNKKYRED